MPERYSQAELVAIAGAYLHENVSPGDPGYCRPEAADWTVEQLSTEQLAHVFSSAQEAQAWLDGEIAMGKEDRLRRGWDRLLVEDIREEVVATIIDGTVHLWDGYHRVAASVARGLSVAAIVGRPRPD